MWFIYFERYCTKLNVLSAAVSNKDLSWVGIHSVRGKTTHSVHYTGKMILITRDFVVVKVHSSAWSKIFTFTFVYWVFVWFGLFFNTGTTRNTHKRKWHKSVMLCTWDEHKSLSSDWIINHRLCFVHGVKMNQKLDQLHCFVCVIYLRASVHVAWFECHNKVQDDLWE